MDDEQLTLADRARAAWREAEQEMQVEVERRRMERTLALVRDATAAVKRLYGEQPVPELGASNPILGDNEDEVSIYPRDGLALRFTRDWAGNQHLDVVRGSCRVCGALLYAGPVTDLLDLGRHLTEDVQHACPDPEPVWEGDLTLGAAMAKSDDPALTLLDAMQGYIHAAVEAAVAGKSWVNDDEVIPLTPARPATIPYGQEN